MAQHSVIIEDMCRTVRNFARKSIPPLLSGEPEGGFPHSFFVEAAELGLCGLTISEKYGGIEASSSLSAALYSEISNVNLGPAIFLSVHNMVAGLIQKFGTSAQCQEFLPRMATGEILGAFALTEPNAGSNAAALRTTAKKSASAYVLNGEKCWITSAGFAGLYLTFARTDGEQGEKNGISAFIVLDTDSGMQSSAPEKKMGCELSPIASVHYNNCSVNEDGLLGTRGKGYGVALGGLSGGRINIAACACGLAKAAINTAYNYMNEREQFGKKLSEFQGLQFMLADMQMQLEASQALTERAAQMLDETPDSRENRLLPSIAKCFATDSAMKICTDAVQLLGGAGYVRDYQVEGFMRDAKMLQIVEGTNQIQRQIIAKEMGFRYE